MISVSAAQSQILARVPSPAPPEVVTVAEARGRVLAEDVRSAMDVPPTDNSAVDGYAVGSADIPEAGTRSLEVVADLPAGVLYPATLERGLAVRIMTGAPIPVGADTVYPQEAVTRTGARIEVLSLEAGANVRYRGEDVRAGQIVLGAGSLVRAQEMGVAASLGLTRLLVRQRPRVAILSTGDEVAEPGGERSPAQIYDANRFTLRGLVEGCGAVATDCGIIPDRFDELRTHLLAAAGSHDVVLTSGGVSVGDHDLVKAVLQDAGNIDFWQVAMQPGRPVAVGRILGAHFFGLPGNPVATMLTFHLFVRPALWKLAGRRELEVPRFRAVAAAPMKKKRGRREFKRGLLTYRDPHWEVTTTGPQGSGILTSMTQANCLIIIEEDAGDVAPGDLSLGRAVRPGLSRVPVSRGIEIELIDRITPMVLDLVTARAAMLADLRYAGVHLAVSEGRYASAEDGAPKASGDGCALAFGIRVLAGSRMVAPGYFGRGLGAADVPNLEQVLRDGLHAAYRRAMANAEQKALVRAKYPVLGESLADTRLASVPVRHAVVPAVYEIDPREVALEHMVRFSGDVSREVGALGPSLRYNYVSTSTALRRELFASSEGALIDQSLALTQGLCYAVAAGPDNSQEIYDVIGHQRGWEILERGMDEGAIRFPPFSAFAEGIGADAAELAAAPALPTLDHDVTVVTDPHYNTLLSHEIIGHPVELDRGLKMEAAYAGRSWLLRGLDEHQVGKQVASPLVSAYSDPTLPGYGHYAYDHEGTPARRVVHIDRGVFRGFMNSRQTAAVFGGEPNGHWTSTDAALVPLVRMSSTVFAAGDRAPADIIGEVDRGYYLVGHKIPSIAESRENFRISARKVYEISGGHLGRLYRDGGIMADSREYLMKVDAVGDDFRLYPIPNCGKGQPMQTKKLGNGGPTMRSRAILTGGRQP